MKIQIVAFMMCCACGFPRMSRNFKMPKAFPGRMSGIGYPQIASVEIFPYCNTFALHENCFNSFNTSFATFLQILLRLSMLLQILEYQRLQHQPMLVIHVQALLIPWSIAFPKMAQNRLKISVAPHFSVALLNF